MRKEGSKKRVKRFQWAVCWQSCYATRDCLPISKMTESDSLHTIPELFVWMRPKLKSMTKIPQLSLKVHVTVFFHGETCSDGVMNRCRRTLVPMMLYLTVCQHIRRCNDGMESCETRYEQILRRGTAGWWTFCGWRLAFALFLGLPPEFGGFMSS